MIRFLYVSVLFFSVTSSAQDSLASKDSLAENPQRTNWGHFKYDLGTMFKSVAYSYTRPYYWKGKQWAHFGGAVAGTGLVYAFDDETSRFIRSNRESVPKWIRDYGELYGSPENNFLATSGVYLVGLFAKNEKLRRTGVLLVASAASSGFLQQILKSAVGRARPVADLGKFTFDPFSSDREFHSFPSGHALLAFSNAYAIGKQFRSPWIKAGVYTLGAIPGISRIWDNQHWLSDFVFAIVISVATVESIDRYLDGKYDKKYNDAEQRRASLKDKKVSWDLNFGAGTLGVSVNF